MSIKDVDIYSLGHHGHPSSHHPAMAAAVAAAGLHPDTDTDPRELEAFAERFKQRRIKLGSYLLWILIFLCCPFGKITQFPRRIDSYYPTNSPPPTLNCPDSLSQPCVRVPIITISVFVIYLFSHWQNPLTKSSFESRCYTSRCR